MITNIQNVVIHALNKEQHQPIKASAYREKVLDPANEVVIKLVNGIVDKYGSRHSTAHYGVFKTGEGRGQFPPAFETYYKVPQPTGKQFMGVTHVAMDALYQRAQQEILSTGGYIVFADYSSDQGRFFLVAMIKQRPGLVLTEDLEPEELMELDLSRLYQAARVNFGKFSSYLSSTSEQRQEQSYLSFISPAATRTAAGYFITALGCAAGAASARATDSVFKESKALFRKDEKLKPHCEAFENSLMQYMERKLSLRESVKLGEVGHLVRQHIPPELSEKADDIVDAFIHRLNGEEFSVPVEFPVNKSVLRKHTHISGKGDAWKLDFDRQVLGDSPDADVYFNRKNGTLTVKGLPENMRRAIEEELDGRKER